MTKRHQQFKQVKYKALSEQEHDIGRVRRKENLHGSLQRQASKALVQQFQRQRLVNRKEQKQNSKTEQVL